MAAQLPKATAMQGFEPHWAIADHPGLWLYQFQETRGEMAVEPGRIRAEVEGHGVAHFIRHRTAEAYLRAAMEGRYQRRTE